MGALNERLKRIPFVLFALMYCIWLGFDYYLWQGATDGDLANKRQAIEGAKKELETAKKKLVAGEEFVKNLNSIRTRIRQLTAQLDGTKTTLSADLDVGNFIRIITLEAQKVGVTIRAIKPQKEVKKDYYIEVPFTVNLRGAFAQILVFFDRVARFQQVIRIGDFEMQPINTASQFAKYVELDGSVKLIAYRYLGTHADEIMNKQEMRQEAKMDAKPNGQPETQPKAASTSGGSEE